MRELTFDDACATLGAAVRDLGGRSVTVEIRGDGRVELRFESAEGFQPLKTIRADISPDGADVPPSRAVEELRRAMWKKVHG